MIIDHSSYIVEYISRQCFVLCYLSVCLSVCRICHIPFVHSIFNIGTVTESLYFGGYLVLVNGGVILRSNTKNYRAFITGTP